MRPGSALVLALVSAVLPGCFTPEAERAVALMGARRLFSGPTGDDVVSLSVALVERPVSDRSLNVELWELLNEQVVDSDQRAVLAKNGFRVGRVGGSPPPALHDLICSERNSCANPRRIQLRAGNPNTVLLGPAWAQCRFRLDREGKTSDADLGQAVCQLQVVPKLSDDGRVTLRFTPFIKHGELKQKPVAVRTPGGELQWELQIGQDEETYDWLAWEVTVDANDTVVVGTRPDAADTLGQRCFTQTETTVPVQRLLVLRVGRLLTDPAAKAESARGGLALAIQAGLAE